MLLSKYPASVNKNTKQAIKKANRVTKKTTKFKTKHTVVATNDTPWSLDNVVYHAVWPITTSQAFPASSEKHLLAGKTREIVIGCLASTSSYKNGNKSGITEK